MSRNRALFPLLVIVLFLVPGCTQIMDSIVEPRATLNANPLNIQVGDTVGFDGRDSDPIEGLITEYLWDFGDGSTQSTVNGYTTHLFESPGVFVVTLKVVNDQGGEDTATVTISVNGPPIIDLIIPEGIRAGDIVRLDASNSYDAENSELVYMWDLNLQVDSDGDGNPSNDIDAFEAVVNVQTEKSMTINGMLTIDDGQGGIASEIFTLNVQTRKYKVVWKTEELTWDWGASTEEGETWSSNITPGESGRVISYYAELILDSNDIQPADNFTLRIRIPSDGYTKSNETTPGNITRNEETRTEIEDDALNPIGEDGEYESDSEEDLLLRLMTQSDARFGQEDWICYVIADQSDPDSLLPDILPDPDTGNNWTLEITVEIQVPMLSEIAYQ
ncbi:MAG: PKD domain-containing protein [Candidatus Thermoplasmatota archaeon]|nr:PKD domain-containing protein [Candidatus Thermoplasmatota archaeon]